MADDLVLRQEHRHTGQLRVIIIVGILVGTVVAAQTLYLFTLDNLKQHAALKAIGVKNAMLGAMVLQQSSTSTQTRMRGRYRRPTNSRLLST